jgi:hypothetical protein
MYEADVEPVLKFLLNQAFLFASKILEGDFIFMF